MKKALTKIEKKLYHYKDGKRIKGKNDSMIGNCTGLTGNCTYLTGNCTGLSGNCSNLRGYCTGLRGNCSGLSGNLDDCEITEEERKKGIDIRDLVGE